MTSEEIESLNDLNEYKKRDKPSEVCEYLNIIYKMLRDGHKHENIYWYIMSKGFNGTDSQLRNAIICIAKNNFHKKIGRFHFRYAHKEGSIVIKRNDLLMEITTMNPKREPCKIIQDNLPLIEAKYPIVKTVREIFSEFYSAIMGDKIEKLDEFISKYEPKKDEEDERKSYSPISSFVNGLKKDIHPARNAISFPESSGFVEGNNNKFKLIKRILYGRANLSNLFRKCYFCFLFKKTDFSLKNSFSLSKDN